MRRQLFIALLLLVSLGAPHAADAQVLKLWLDGKDPSSMILSPGNVVERWRDKSGLHNDLVRMQFTPMLFPGGGVELVERHTDETDRLQGTALLAAERQEFVMILACIPYSGVDRLYAFAGNNMSLLNQSGPTGTAFTLQIMNNCPLVLNPARDLLRDVEVYATRRIPNGIDTINTLWREKGNLQVTAGAHCFSGELHTLRFDNGSTNSPTNPNEGMVVLEVVAYAGSIFAPGPGTNTESVLSDEFVRGKMQELDARWNGDPTTVQSSTWGRIKLLER